MSNGEKSLDPEQKWKSSESYEGAWGLGLVGKMLSILAREPDFSSLAPAWNAGRLCEPAIPALGS